MAGQRRAPGAWSRRLAQPMREPVGTRFLLFPQPPFLEGFEQGEHILVSPPAGTVGPGPADDRMYAVYPVDKLNTYGEDSRLNPPTPPGRRGEPSGPPWRGPAFAPAMPGPDGHFDHLEPGTPQFEAAHLYGAARFVLDVWEDYFGRRIDWHFGDRHERMELLINPRFHNATMGYGYLEIGGYELVSGEYRPFSLNFDVIGHEVGHSIVYPIIGLPTPETIHDDYYGFHESAADLIGLIAAMHFGTVIDDVLESTRGNLYTINKLNRMGEVTDHKQLRLASNTTTLEDFVDGWHDEHDISQPLTGAIFDLFVHIFHDLLVRRGVISQRTSDLSESLEEHPDYERIMHALFDEHYLARPHDMKATLLDARDHIAHYLVGAFRRLNPELTFPEVGEALMAAEREISGGRYAEFVQGYLARRGIFDVAIGPRLGMPGEDSHLHSVRTAVPPAACPSKRMSYIQQYQLRRK
jgi:hypothetical protein